MNRSRAYAVLVNDAGTLAALSAFRRATGLFVKLIPIAPQTGPAVRPSVNPLCAMINQTDAGQAACANFSRRLQSSPHPKRCFAGLTELAVPVMYATQPIALLVCGQVLQRRPTRAGFDRIIRRLRRAGLKIARSRAAAAFFRTPVATADKLRAATLMLGFLATYLADTANRRLLASQADEPACVAVAKRFVREHLTERFTTCQVATAAGVNPQHFCRVFKLTTGMPFSEYHGRVRIENAKALLADPRRRVSEVAFDSGVESIPYFNRLFKRYVGVSPQAYRLALKIG